MQTSKVIEHYPILGVPLAAVDYEQAAAITGEWLADLEANPVRAVGAANTHFVTTGRRDPVFRAHLEKFDLIVPDGMPLVWVMNHRGAGLKDRVYGPSLMLRILQLPNVSHFLLGGTEEMLGLLKRNLQARFPELRIAGSYAPPFGTWPEEEDQKIRSLIAESGAKIVWVGLGCPKQETWIARNKPHLPPAIYFAVGAAFPFHSGLVKQAPVWMQKRGLEWLFRLAAEPRRLWKRYAVCNTLFLYYLFRDALFGTPRPAFGEGEKAGKSLSP